MIANRIIHTSYPGSQKTIDPDGIYRGMPANCRFNVITMCGSTKFKEDYMEWMEKLTFGGAVVLMCPVFHHADNTSISEDKHKLLRDIHMQRIRMADAIFVVNKNGYIGPSTKEEIEYATSLRKNIWYMETIKIEGDDENGFKETGE